jgi:hypothetical protein
MRSFKHRRRSASVHHDLNRITRDQMNCKEGDQRHADQHRQHLKQPPNNVFDDRQWETRAEIVAGGSCLRPRN